METKQQQKEDVTILFSIDSAKAGYTLSTLLAMAAKTDSGNGPVIFLTLEDQDK